MKRYLDNDILTIIDDFCDCHPYSGPTCTKCKRMEYLWDNQVKDLKRLLDDGVLRKSDTDGDPCYFEVV